MFYLVKVKDDNSKGILSVTLSDLLFSMRKKISQYNWSIYELSATGKINIGINLPELEKKIFNLKTGLRMSWTDLLNLANKLDQVIELILVASVNDEVNFKEYKDNDQWRNQYEMVIEIIDGAYWEVYSKDQDLVRLLSETYTNIEVLCIS